MLQALAMQMGAVVGGFQVTLGLLLLSSLLQAQPRPDAATDAAPAAAQAAPGAAPAQAGEAAGPGSQPPSAPQPAATQEPVPQEPVPQEPVPQEPVPQEPVPQEPVPQEPVPQEPVPQQPPGPRMQLTPPPLLPPAPRSYHNHDGFYVRLNIGAGILGASVNNDSESVPDYSGSGFGLDLDVFVGGTPSPGLSLGGAVMLGGGSTSDIEVEGASVDEQAGISSVLMAFFLDGFPDNNRGFHLGGAVGLAAARVSRDSRSDLSEHKGGGLGGAAWLGYGGWVAPEWTLGGMLRFLATLTSDDQNGDSQTAQVYSLALMFSALYN